MDIVKGFLAIMKTPQPKEIAKPIDYKRYASGRKVKVVERLPSNNTSGVLGVSWVTAKQRFVVTHGRGKAWAFKTLLDAVCKRKSLELETLN